MFKKFSVENIIKGKTATGVEVILLPDGNYEINYVTLKKNKSLFSIEQQGTGLEDISKVANEMGKKTPVILVINGKGIIHRKVLFSENDSQAALLNKVLPNANLSEFYIQQDAIDVVSTFISVIRKNTADEIVNTFKNNGISSTVGLSLGPFVINDLVPLIDESAIDNGLLSIRNYQLQLKDQKISEIAFVDAGPDDRTIPIADEKVPSKIFVAYAAALSYFIDPDKGVADSEPLEQIKNEYRQRQKFSFFSWTLLLSTFIVLIVNYFIFNNYWAKNNEINSRLLINQSALKKYEALKLEYSQKKEFLEQNGLLENSLTSYYADQLATGVPASIQWTNLDIHPLKKKDPNDLSETLTFENKTIRVSGICDRNTELNEWMKDVKKKSWIADVILLNYIQDNAADDGVFSIEIKLK